MTRQRIEQNKVFYNQMILRSRANITSALIIPDDDLEVTGTETTYEMNLAIFKIKRTVKKGK
jgi:hypothetical protein